MSFGSGCVGYFFTATFSALFNGDGMSGELPLAESAMMGEECGCRDCNGGHNAFCDTAVPF